MINNTHAYFRRFCYVFAWPETHFYVETEDLPAEPPAVHLFVVVGEAAYEAKATCFQRLETGEVQPGGFFGDTPTKGLALPREVLERIYCRNAARIYPRVGDVLQDLGYDVSSLESLKH